MNPDDVLAKMLSQHQHLKVNTADGLRIDFEDGWVHMRKSNTEPIIRIYAESSSTEKANELAVKMINQIKALFGI